MPQRLVGDGITRIGPYRGGRAGRQAQPVSVVCARGEDDRPVDAEREARSMSSEITLDEDVADPDRLRPITGIDTMLQARNQLRVGRDSRRAKGLGSNLHEHRRQDIILLAVAQKHRRRWASGK